MVGTPGEICIKVGIRRGDCPGDKLEDPGRGVCTGRLHNLATRRESSERNVWPSSAWWHILVMRFLVILELVLIFVGLFTFCARKT